MPTLFKTDALLAVDRISPANDTESRVKRVLMDELKSPTDWDSPDILLTIVEEDFDSEHNNQPGKPAYQDGIDFLIKYNLMP